MHVFTKSLRMAAIVVAVGTSALIAVNASANTVTPRTAACTSANTDDWLNTAGSGAAGSVYYNLQFTNVSGASCTLYGYPGVSAVNLGGGQIGHAATRDAGTVATITVAAHGTVKAQLRITNASLYVPSQCSLTQAAGLRVYAPGSTTGRIVPFPFDTCAKPALNVISVGPVTH